MKFSDSGSTNLKFLSLQQVKYECAAQHEGEIKIVGPDWVVESVQAKKAQDERTFHPKYITEKATPTEGAIPMDVEMKTAEDDAAVDEAPAQKEKKEKTVRPKMKLHVPWADELMPLPDISGIPETMRDAPPSSNTATSSTMSQSSASVGAPYSASSAGFSTPTHKSKDKKHKKEKKKKKKHKKEKKKKDKKKHKHGGGSGGQVEGASAQPMAQAGGKIRTLRNITNKTEYLPSMAGESGDKKHISQVCVLSGICIARKDREHILGEHFVANLSGSNLDCVQDRVSEDCLL